MQRASFRSYVALVIHYTLNSEIKPEKSAAF